MAQTNTFPPSTIADRLGSAHKAEAITLLHALAALLEQQADALASSPQTSTHVVRLYLRAAQAATDDSQQQLSELLKALAVEEFERRTQTVLDQ